MSRSKATILAGGLLILAALALLSWAGTAQAAVVDRASVTSVGDQANDASTSCAVSADGRYVVFLCYASNLVAGDTNGESDVFVHDRDTGETTRVSVATGGAQGNSYCGTDLCISADGRYVVFTSYSTNLVNHDTNSAQDVFLHDRNTGETTRVSVNSAGTQGDYSSWGPSISADGRYVAFASAATNLVTGDTNAAYDVFVRDRNSNTTTRVSVSSAGAQGTNYSYSPALTPDGRFVAFLSDAGNLVTGDTNGKADVFVRDRTGGTTERVSLAQDGAQAVLESASPSISADGRYVAFGSYAWNLVTGDWNGTWDVFVRDRVAGTTELVSQSSSGAKGNFGARWAGTISANGRYVSFSSETNDFVPGDTNGVWDYFVRDRSNGLTTLVSLTSSGGQKVGGGGGKSAISADGRYVVFTNEAGNLVSGDTNGKADVFVAGVDWTPVIARLSPTLGSVGGKDTVTITGNCFLAVTAVTFGGIPATSFTAVNPSQVTATAPAHAPGSVQVQITAGGVSTADTSADDYTYNLPLITAIAPNHGSTAGGTTVVITGTFLTGTSAVTFGGEAAAAYTIDSATRITATSPGHPLGSVQVQVQAGDYFTSDTPADNYTYYEPPTITGIDTTSGPVTGGTVVTITGTEFATVTGPGGVTFGGKNALSYTIDSATGITATSPFHVAGTVQVKVTGGGGSTEDTSADDFTYLAESSGPLQAHERVSVDSAEVQGGNDSAFPSVSDDGRYVAFMSLADNLVLGDINQTMDVFVRDRETGITERVSVATDGTEGNDASGNPAISGDGRYVGFCSDATNLVPGDSYGATDIFVYDRLTGTTERVSVSSAGVPGNNESFRVALSNDGRYVAFSSLAANLVSGDVSTTYDIFVHDRQTHTTEMVSVNSSEVMQNGDCDFVSISGDGRFVAFDSDATNLSDPGFDNVWDVFVRDRQLGTTERVSVTGSTAVPDDSSGFPHISDDGRYVSFQSWAENLVSSDNNGVSDIFLRDRTNGTTRLVSISSSGTQGNGDSDYAAVSADGRYVAFESMASNLVSGDTNGYMDIFVRDRVSGTTRRVSVDAAGAQADNESYWPSITADGSYIAFGSTATNLVPGDSNAYDDVFAVLTPTIPSYPSYLGTDRFDTAIRVSQASYPAPLPAGSGVVLAPGWESYQEALCGSPLAAAWGGPVLLSSKTVLYGNVSTELQRLAPARVFCIGLTAALADAVRAALPAATVTSINGTGTTANIVYDMSYQVAKALGTKVGDMSAATAIVTTGTNFPDAIGVSPLACAKKWPILLTNNAEAALHAKSAQALSELGITQALKVGTYATLPAGVAGVGNCSGADRYYTNAAVAVWAKASAGLTYAHTGITTGDKFPDALAAGPYLAKDNGTLLLSPLLGPLPPAIAAVLTTNRAEVQFVTFVACIEPVIGQVKALLP